MYNYIIIFVLFRNFSWNLDIIAIIVTFLIRISDKDIPRILKIETNLLIMYVFLLYKFLTIS